MDKWVKYGSYENWVNSNESNLREEYKAYIEKNYNPIEPDTYVSYDDFCGGQWQWMN